MNITYRTYQEQDIEFLQELWNDILVEGVAFPGEVLYEQEGFEHMLQEQSAVTCILVDDEVAGYFVLHPNNIGRCSHVANASYAVSKNYRGKKLAEPLVRKSVEQAKELGFKGMQFNAVVAGNISAIHTYQKIGFEIVGTIPQGFRLKSGEYSNMHIMYLAFN